MGDAKRAVANLARVEGSICAFYLHYEITYFYSHYFKTLILLCNTSLRHDPRVDPNDGEPQPLTIFKKSGRPSEACKDYWLTYEDFQSAHVHIFINCNEVKPLLE